jgi:AcrR family transcriptional regulator
MKELNQKLQPRKKPQQSRSQQTKEYILLGAARLLEKSGLKHFNTNAISVESGVGVGSIYQYFPNKEAIMVALIDYYFELQDHQFLEYLENDIPKNSSVKKSVPLAIENLYKILFSLPRISRLLLEQADSFQVQNILKEKDQKVVDRFYNLLKLSGECPNLSKEKIRYMVEATKGMNHYFFTEYKELDFESNEAQRLIETVTNLTLTLFM